MAADCSPWCLNFLLSLCGCMRSLPSLLAHSAALVEFHGVLFLVPWSSYVISHPCLLLNCPLSSDAHLRSRWQKRLRSQPWVAVHDVGNSQQHLPHQKWYRPCDVNERGVLVLPCRAWPFCSRPLQGCIAVIVVESYADCPEATVTRT